MRRCAFDELFAHNSSRNSRNYQIGLATNALAGWISTGISLEVGDPFEVDARGMWDAEGLILAPRHVLWYRVSEDGTARNFPSDDLFAVSEASGELEIAIRPPSFYWFDKQGTFPPEILDSPEVAVSFTLEIRQSGALHSARQSEAGKNLTQNFPRSEDRPPKDFKYLTYSWRVRSLEWSSGKQRILCFCKLGR